MRRMKTGDSSNRQWKPGLATNFSVVLLRALQNWVLNDAHSWTDAPLEGKGNFQHSLPLSKEFGLLDSVNK